MPDPADWEEDAGSSSGVHAALLWMVCS